MVFTSHAFIYYFLPLVLLGYYGLPRPYRRPFLALASYVFYGWWSPWFVLLMLFSTVVDYRCGRAIARPGASVRSRRLALWTSVVVNLGLLGFFKYFMFFTENVNAVLGALGGTTLPVWEIVLPVGISFYTFQSMSYSIDIYRGDARQAPSFVDFAAYVSLFPQLVAGPIIRYRDIAEQLYRPHHSMSRFAEGLAYFAFGFAKKLVLANNLGEVADAVFGAHSPPWHLAWVGLVAYAFQIYFDFSGYSDMAIGLGRMLGFDFPQNFRSPYHAESITDFWRRWHISLSTWLRDYLYIPLGGNRHGSGRTYANLAITMLLGGLWHGAEWRFIAWGALHGSLLAAERASGKRGLLFFAPRPVRVLFTFFLVLITWVFFRAETLGAALAYLGSLFALREATAGSALLSGTVYAPFPLLVLLLSAVLVAWGRRTQQWVEGARSPGSSQPAGLDSVRRLSPAVALMALALFAVGALEMAVQSHNPFLYFQF